MAGAITFEESGWPLVRIYFRDRPTDEEFRAYLDRAAGYLDRPERYALLLITLPDTPMTTVRHARWQARWLEEHFERLRDRCLGTGFVLPSPVMRGVLRMIMNRTTLPSPHKVARHEEDLEDWARGLLARSPDAA